MLSSAIKSPIFGMSMLVIRSIVGARAAPKGAAAETGAGAGAGTETGLIVDRVADGFMAEKAASEGRGAPAEAAGVAGFGGAVELFAANGGGGKAVNFGVDFCSSAAGGMAA
jgi:hypothetical protein